MSNDNKGAGDTEVSGAEAVATKYNKNINKNVKITTYADRKVTTAQDTEDFKKRGEENVRKATKPITLGFFEDALAKNAYGNREYFVDKVAGGKGYTTLDGKHISKTTFEQMSAKEQDKIYGQYMEDRRVGRTDARGNVGSGWRKEKIRHTDKYGNVTYKDTWMHTDNQDGGGQGGSNYGGVPNQYKTEEQIAKENKAVEDAEAATKISEEEYKKRRGLKGSRSMFGYAGGRGYFDTV